MIERVAVGAAVVSTVGCGLVVGLLFAFSASVMPALSRLAAADGIAAMRSINVAILNPAFGLVFFGTTVSCVVLVATAPFAGVPAAVWRLGGALLFLIGTFGVTIAINVPLNNALAAVDSASADVAGFWERYVARWTAWNHVRTLAATAATTTLALSLQPYG